MPLTITEGPFAGWMRWRDEPNGRFSDIALGQFYFRDEDQNKVRCRIDTGHRHTNNADFIHGGMMMAFADMAYFAVAWKLLEDVFAVTLSATFEFVGAAKPGEPIDAVGEILKETGKLIFVHVRMEQNGQLVATTTATLRKLSRTVARDNFMRTEG
jgi:uncharacterized protein (TIGR00369 family)